MVSGFADQLDGRIYNHFVIARIDKFIFLTNSQPTRMLKFVNFPKVDKFTFQSIYNQPPTAVKFVNTRSADKLKHKMLG